MLRTRFCVCVLCAALAALDQTLAIDDRHAAVHYLRGRVLWQLQRFNEAREAFIRAKEEDVCPLRAPQAVVETVKDMAVRRGVPVVDFAKMIDDLAEHHVPGDDWFLDHVHPTIEGNYRLALALVREMDHAALARVGTAWNDAAAVEVKHAVESRLDMKAHGQAICNVAKIMAWAGKYDDAYRSALRAEKLSPDDAAIQLEVGKNAYHVHRYSEAIGHLEKALALNPRFVEADLLLANALGATTNFEAAIAACRSGMELRPADPNLHMTLANLLAHAGRTNEAMEHLRQAVHLAPDDAEAHSNFGWMLKDTGQLTEGLAQFEEAIRLKPGLITARLGLAWLLATHPDDKWRDAHRAISFSERLAEGSQYENWMTLDTLAASYAAAGRFDDAIRTQRQAVGLVQQTAPLYQAPVRERLELYERRTPFREAMR